MCTAYGRMDAEVHRSGTVATLHIAVFGCPVCHAERCLAEIIKAEMPQFPMPYMQNCPRVQESVLIPGLHCFSWLKKASPSGHRRECLKFLYNYRA